MKIETKFNIGDEVWVMDCNRPEKYTIEGIFIERTYTKNDCYGCIMYYLSEATFHHYLEDQIFRTKEELLKSL